MPDSLDVLHRLGITLPAGAGARFRGIRFSDGRSSVVADFAANAGVAVRRTVLHSLLTRRAEECQVNFVWGAKHVQLAKEGISIDGRRIASKLVVGADGHNSRVRRQAGLDRMRTERSRFGFRRHYLTTPWTSYMELYWGPKSQIYIAPVSNQEICVSLVSGDSKLRLDRALENYPEVSARLHDAVPVSSEKGGMSVSRSLRRVCRPGLALVGDASGSIDAVTGEGLCISFKQALALADAFAAGDLRAYESAHRRISRRPRMMAFLLLLLEGHTISQHRALAALARHPDVFASLLAIHVGERSFGDLFSWRFVDFCRTYLAA